MYNEPSRKAVVAYFSTKGGQVPGKQKPVRREITDAGLEVAFHTKSEFQRMRARVAAATLRSMQLMAVNR